MLRMLVLMLALTAPFSVQPVTMQGASTLNPSVEPAAERASLASDKKVTFDTVNDISLYDTAEDLVDKCGQPVNIEHNRLLGSEEYIYGDMRVGINNGIVHYVQVDKNASYLKVNNEYMEMNPSSIRATLGEPDFVAQDGEVYVRDHHAVKVYMNPDNGRLQHVEFFDEFSF
ncbi:hypothetical protein ACFQ3J_23120 [Paenibacillus provencensis]|uniref:Uncharacterized protein n=1 Tax=Paenibacillus provencensis TaxID=441151 RepID=A0ABW3Q0G2_9BACL|nr:hypothetical protein [Paenibacillus sp. MER 78]MCM3130405.1 hypothetical protein [Paenibacillus sp. MER 78]